MPKHVSSRSLFVIALASTLPATYWIGCNAIVGNDEARYVPKVAAEAHVDADAGRCPEGMTSCNGSGEPSSDASARCDLGAPFLSMTKVDVINSAYDETAARLTP